MWIAKVTGSRMMMCKKQTLCCKVGEQREHWQEGTSKRSPTHASVAHLLNSPSWPLDKKFQKRLFPQTPCQEVFPYVWDVFSFATRVTSVHLILKWDKNWPVFFAFWAVLRLSFFFLLVFVPGEANPFILEFGDSPLIGIAERGVFDICHSCVIQPMGYFTHQLAFLFHLLLEFPQASQLSQICIEWPMSKDHFF